MWTGIAPSRPCSSRTLWSVGEDEVGAESAGRGGLQGATGSSTTSRSDDGTGEAPRSTTWRHASASLITCANLALLLVLLRHGVAALLRDGPRVRRPSPAHCSPRGGVDDGAVHRVPSAADAHMVRQSPRPRQIWASSCSRPCGPRPYCAGYASGRSARGGRASPDLDRACAPTGIGSHDLW